MVCDWGGLWAAGKHTTRRLLRRRRHEPSAATRPVAAFSWRERHSWYLLILVIRIQALGGGLLSCSDWGRERLVFKIPLGRDEGLFDPAGEVSTGPLSTGVGCETAQGGSGCNPSMPMLLHRWQPVGVSICSHISKWNEQYQLTVFARNCRSNPHPHPSIFLTLIKS